jgi:hypothetical protein
MQNGAIDVTIILNPMDPVLVGDPLIEHGVITDCQKCYQGSLSGGHFLGKPVARIFLQEGSIAYNEPNCKNNWATGWYWWSVGGSCHCQKGVLFLSRKNFKFLRARKEAQEAFDAKTN